MKSLNLHVKALSTHFECAMVFASVALFGDLFWLGYEIYIFGMSVGYGIVGIFLSISLIGTLGILFDRHRNTIKEIRSNLLQEKLTILKCKQKHNQKQFKKLLNY